MKQIGIKLADGSFYPIMEEGQPVKKTLGLTTVNDNQTRVLVDVYRSKTGTMEDAEYIDTLQIDNLVEHPNGQNEINLDIGLDENNKLIAEMKDPETGATSNANVTLVSRTLEERLEPTNYDVKLGEDGPVPVEDNIPEEEAFDADGTEGSVAAGVLAGAAIGGLATAAVMNSMKDDEEASSEVASEEVNDDFDLPDFGESSPLEENIADEPAVDAGESLASDEFDLPDFGEETSSGEEEISVPVADETSAAEDPFATVETSAAEDPFAADETSATDSFDLPDFGEETPAATDETVADETTAAEDPFAADETAATDSFDLPDFGEETPAATDETVTDETSDDNFGAGVAAGAAIGGLAAAAAMSNDNDETVADDTFATDDFDLPDFNETAASDASAEETAINEDDAFFNTFEETSKEDDFASDLVKDNTPSNGINFDGLYDKETVEGERSSDEIAEDVKKKTRAPVIICIICAIICVIATALILFVLPSKYNLLSKSQKTEKPVVEEVVKEEPVAEPEVVEAKENEVVVAEPEMVIPEPPKEPENKPKDIRYKIKWGDTLWDIADAYYKNPWNYKKIARYNNIQNPDHIISGTYITIPAK